MSTRVQTQSGEVEGEARGGHVAFRGIPFAKPPVGALRFCAPVAPEPWSGVRPARAFSPASMQGSFTAAGIGDDGAQSEDCLYLNVYRPGAALDGTAPALRGGAASSGERRPVLFWIHGGGFTVGSAAMPIYDGGHLAERGDVVVVTINYRLGALGYAYLGAHGGERLNASANLGQLDQIAALRWVRDNIASFGGDPNNVTIFGESAGSMAVCTLLVTPSAKGLFHRAVAQSGAALKLARTEDAAKVTQALLDDLGIAAGQIEQLRDVPAARLIQAQSKVGMMGNGRGFAPIQDGEVIPLQPEEAIKSGGSAEVPFIIGTTRDELNLFTMPLLRDLDKPMADEKAISILNRDLSKQTPERIGVLLEAYRAARKQRGLPHSNRALIGAVQTDLRFRMPSIAFAEAYGARQPSTFMYLFTYESPAMRGALRSCHALEIPFVFGTLDAPHQDKFAGAGPAVEALSETMMTAWLAFAKAGNPSHERADWVPYDRTRRATMVFDKQSSLQDDPYREERVSWDGTLG